MRYEKDACEKNKRVNNKSRMELGGLSLKMYCRYLVKYSEINLSM